MTEISLFRNLFKYYNTIYNNYSTVTDLAKFLG
jgi:hypothetical protein